MTPLSTDFEDMFRGHRPVLSSPSTSRDIPILRDINRSDGGHVINIMRDDDNSNGNVVNNHCKLIRNDFKY